MILVVFILNLGSQIVTDVAHVGDVVLPTSGTSGDMESDTWPARQLALVNIWRYLEAKVRLTGSCISMVTASSSLSTLAVWASLILPTPMSPAAENLTPSLVTSIRTDSPNWERSRTTLWNSPEGIFMTA